jgi:spermidine synthase
MAEGQTASAPPHRYDRLVVLTIGGLGVSAILTQLVLLREMLSAFCGNEMVLGIILGNWLLATGLGSFLGRTAGKLKNPLVLLIVAGVLIAVLPPAEVLALRIFRDQVFTRGAMIGTVETAVASFLLLLPYCLVSGYLLTLACSVLFGSGERACHGVALQSRAIGRVYLADSIGSIAGGALFSFVLVQRLDHFTVLYLPAAILLPLACLTAWRLRRRVLLGVALAALAGLIAVIVGMNLDSLTTRLQYPFQKVLFSGNSPYGRLVVTESAGQVNFIENGLPAVSTGNVQQVEETVHYAMAQRPGAKAVLLIGGGVSGTAKEILKYGVREVTYVELDPRVIELGRRFLPASLDDPRIGVVNTDGRQFLRQTDPGTPGFDVVILDTPEPATAQVNRFYTAEFFAQLKRHLSADGVVSLAIGQFDGHVSPELARMLASARRTLETSFARVQLIPGGRVFLLASDGPLYADVAARIEAAGVVPKLVQRHYLDAMLTPDRLAAVQAAAAQLADVNRDFRPILYYYHLLYWTSQFATAWAIPLAAAIFVLVIYLAGMRAVPFAILTSGFSASALEIVLLLGFQALCGSVYYQLGVIVTAFMAGLAIGAGVANRLTVRAPRVSLAALSAAIAILAGVLPFILKALAGWTGPALIQAAVAVTAAVLAGLVGAQFCLAGRSGAAGGTLTASRLYTADLVGACVGAFLASAVLIPLWGLAATCLLAAGLNVAAAVAVARSKA